MPIEFRCKECQTLLRTPDDTAGRRAVCPQCGVEMEVPSGVVGGGGSPYGAPEDYEPPTLPPSSTGEQMAITSLILGISSLCFSCCCLIGLPASIVGIVVGVQGLRSQRRGIAVAGIILCGMGLLANLVSVVVWMLSEGVEFQGFQGFP